MLKNNTDKSIVKSLIELDLIKKGKKKKSTLFNFICYVLVFLLIGGITYFALWFVDMPEIVNFIPLIFLAFLTIMIITNISAQLKILCSSYDLEILSRFPISVKQIFRAKSKIILKKYIISLVIIILPILIAVGIFFNLTYLHFIVLPFSLLSLLALTYLIGFFITLPMFYLVKFLEYKFFIKLVLFLLFLVAGMFVYIYLIFCILSFLLSNNMNDILLKVLYLLNNFAKTMSFAFLYTNIFSNIGYFFLIFCGNIIVYFGILYLYKVAFFNLFAHIYRMYFEKTGKLFKVSKKNKVHKSSTAIFYKDFKYVMRVSTYSFSYLAVALSTPLVLFICNSYLCDMATQIANCDIKLIFSIISILMFICLTNSFSATVVSREGNQFYFSKIMPENAKKQLIAKTFLNFSLAIFISVASAILLLVFNLLKVWEALYLIAITLIFSVANIFCGLNRNIKHPNLTKLNKEELENKSVMSIFFINFLILFITSIAATLLLFLKNEYYALSLYAIVLTAYMIIEIILFFKVYIKKFEKIET